MNLHHYRNDTTIAKLLATSPIPIDLAIRASSGELVSEWETTQDPAELIELLWLADRRQCVRVCMRLLGEKISVHFPQWDETHRIAQADVEPGSGQPNPEPILRWIQDNLVRVDARPSGEAARAMRCVYHAMLIAKEDHTRYVSIMFLIRLMELRGVEYKKADLTPLCEEIRLMAERPGIDAIIAGS